MSYNLFLDDVRTPESTHEFMHMPVYLQADWVVVRDYEEFVSKVLSKGVPDMISFDHDLADAHYDQQNFDYDKEGEEKTGYHCAKWLIDYCLDNKLKVPTKIIVHSMNPIGSLNIKSLFETYFKVYDIDYNPIQENPFFDRVDPRFFL
jgi:hypothetical protein